MRGRERDTSIAMLVLAIVAPCLPAGEAPPAKGPTSDERIEVRADSLTIKLDTIVAKGNVKFQLSALEVQCGRIDITMDKAANTFTQFEASDAVTILAGTRQAEGARARFDVKKKSVVLLGTKEKPPYVKEGANKIWADTIVVRQETGAAEFRGNVRAAVQVKGTTADSKQEMYILADAMDLAGKDSLLVKGNVTIRRDGLEIKCDTLEGEISEETGTFRKLLSMGDVRIVSGERRAWSERAEFDLGKEAVVLSCDGKKQPWVQRDTSKISADRITIFPNTNEARFDGNVHFRLQDSGKGVGGSRKD